MVFILEYFNTVFLQLILSKGLEDATAGALLFVTDCGVTLLYWSAEKEKVEKYM